MLTEPYKPTDLKDWQECWSVTCAACARMPGCDICGAMIESLSGDGPWPDAGFVYDEGAGVSCLSYAPHRKSPKISRQQLRRLARMSPETLPPVCGGCAAAKGTDASKSRHTRRDFEASVKDRRQFLCHERPGYCGGWVRAILARAGKRVGGSTP